LYVSIAQIMVKELIASSLTYILIIVFNNIANISNLYGFAPTRT